MAQEGRLLAAAIEARDRFEGEDAERILVQLGQRHLARLRVVGLNGDVVADSALLGPRLENGEAAIPAGEPQVASERSLLYRLGSLPFRLLRGTTPESGSEHDADISSDLLSRPEVQSALDGRYGAATRISPAPRRSVTLHIAIPVRVEGAIEGIVLVSQSTGRILQALDAVRLDVFKVFLLSLGAAVVLSLVAATTIARPLARLRERAGDILDRRGRLQRRIRGERSARRDRRSRARPGRADAGARAAPSLDRSVCCGRLARVQEPVGVDSNRHRYGPGGRRTGRTTTIPGDDPEGCRADGASALRGPGDLAHRCRSRRRRTHGGHPRRVAVSSRRKLPAAQCRLRNSIRPRSRRCPRYRRGFGRSPDPGLREFDRQRGQLFTAFRRRDHRAPHLAETMPRSRSQTRDPAFPRSTATGSSVVFSATDPMTAPARVTPASVSHWSGRSWSPTEAGSRPNHAAAAAPRW